MDHLLDDLKKELFEKMHQNIVLELEKQKRNLQNMVAEMLTERKGEMLVVMMNKVHREIMKEQEKIMKEQEKMVEDMLAQRKEEMLEEMLNNVHREIKQEVEICTGNKCRNGRLYGRNEVPALCTHSEDGGKGGLTPVAKERGQEGGEEGGGEGGGEADGEGGEG